MVKHSVDISTRLKNGTLLYSIVSQREVVRISKDVSGLGRRFETFTLSQKVGLKVT